MSLNPNVAPSGNFDLSNWKIALPVDSSGGISSTAVEVQNLSGYQSGTHFYTASDGKVHHSHTLISSAWQSDSFYFKAADFLVM